jgi:far upstream element-binding protein
MARCATAPPPTLRWPYAPVPIGEGNRPALLADFTVPKTWCDPPSVTMADDHYSSKRKYEDPSPPPRRTGFSSGPPPASPPAGAPSYNSVPPPPDEIQLAKQRAQEIAARIFNAAEAKRPRVDNGDDDVGGYGGGGSLGSNAGGGGGRIGGEVLGFSSSAGGGHGSSIPPLSSQSGASQYSSYGGYQGTSKKIEIPNGRVGVIIGKAGETIRYLQLQSGAKIQVTRDNEAEPGAQTRPVELSGTPEQISKAEQLIKEVLAEADAGSSGTGSGGRKYNAPQPGADTFQMKIANNKVGLVIGKGGETIKSMQAKSGARIQVIPLHLPAGDTSTERTVHIDGTQEQIEIAKQLVVEVTSEVRFLSRDIHDCFVIFGYLPYFKSCFWFILFSVQFMISPGVLLKILFHLLLFCATLITLLC